MDPNLEVGWSLLGCCWQRHRAEGRGSFTQMRQYQMMIAAMAAVLFYEILITWPQEYRLIWMSKSWSLVKVAYIFTRYVAVGNFICMLVLNFAAISPSACRHTFMLPNTLATLVLMGSCFILSLRLFAIYNRKIWIVVVLGAWAVANACITIYFIAGGTAISLPPEQGGCVGLPHNGPKDSFAFIIVLSDCLFDITCLVLVLLRVISSKYGSRTPLLVLVATQHVGYFLMIGTCLAISVLLTKLHPGKPNMAFPATAALVPIACGRMILSLRAQSLKEGGSSAATPHQLSGGFGRISSSRGGVGAGGGGGGGGGFGTGSKVVRILQNGVQHLDENGGKASQEEGRPPAFDATAIQLTVMQSVHCEGPESREDLQRTPTKEDKREPQAARSSIDKDRKEGFRFSQSRY